MSQSKPHFTKLKLEPWYVLIIAFFVLIALFTAGFFLYQNPTKEIGRPEPRTQVLVKIDSFPAGIPVTFSSSNNQWTVFTEQVVVFEQGKYKVNTALDGLGQVEEQVEVKVGGINTFSFKPQPFNEDKSKFGASLLPSFSSKTDIGLVTENSLMYTSPTQVAIGFKNNDPKQPLIATVIQAKDPAAQSIQVTGYSEKPFFLAEGCNIWDLRFNQDFSKLRYFKNCAFDSKDSERNGFISADLDSGEEKLLLNSSDPRSVARVNISPSGDDMVFRKESGEYGFARDNQLTVVGRDSKTELPAFSPDGKYLIFTRKISDKPAFKDRSLYNNFGLEVSLVETQDFLENKTKARFQVIGQSYVIPDGDSSASSLVSWADNNRFYVGDSPRIFNLQGDVEIPQEDVTEPSRFYTGADNQKYELSSGVFYGTENKQLDINVHSVLSIPDKGFYFLTKNLNQTTLQYNYHLARFVDDKPVIAYPDTILAYKINQNQLFLLTQKGELVTFNF
jgi:hypothetical protein